MSRKGNEHVRIEHVDVKNISSVLYKKEAFSKFKPCAIFVFKRKNIAFDPTN
jgi:hypothetical protein